MKKKFLLLLTLILPLLISAQNLNGRFSSSFYTFERANTISSSETFIRTFQALNLNFNYDKISIRTRLNLESNISKSLDADPRMRFYNLYFEARDLLDFATIKLGRQPLFTPVAGGLFDGVNLRLKYSDFSLTGFYGGNVPAYQKFQFTDDLNNDYVLGGKFETTALTNFRFVVSYIDKNFKTLDYNALRLNVDLDPITILIQQKSNQYKFLLAEASYFLSGILNVNTRYEYDLNYKTTSKIEIDSRISATSDLGFNIYYNYREPKIRYNSILSVFNFGNSQEIEGGIDYQISNGYTVFGKYGYISYENENSQRLTVGANTKFGSISFRKSSGYSGELNSATIFMARSFINGKFTPSLGFSLTTYKLAEDDDVNNLTTILAGLNLRAFSTISFDLQGQYFKSKIYKKDYRVLFKVNYWFNTNF